MKIHILKSMSILLSIIVMLQSCASMTIIDSIPSNSKLYVNGEMVGNTPYKHKDSKIVGSTNIIRIEKEGYKIYKATFSKDEEIDVGAMIGGFFLLVPFLWVMKYKNGHLYELKRININ
ncbi:MAG: PEGA domain-containing protein [Lutibacter sp.]|uniref:PEGA domain-containing protein n=1 Tax=Lutibacter sp. TaxID=1925666 RepID=UPI0017D2F83D|nr:PEGA domain-containing protein [Lutibacter sp.]MBT8316045.1 PEGA domain-containing protein [Lutibacter sp.]NNJ56905.1 PEGA domain-containing protein [Lutibacter sp.]